MPASFSLLSDETVQKVDDTELLECKEEKSPISDANDWDSDVSAQQEEDVIAWPIADTVLENNKMQSESNSKSIRDMKTLKNDATKEIGGNICDKSYTVERMQHAHTARSDREW